MTDLVEYEDSTHTYRVNGVEYPSVSTVLAPFADFSRVPRDVLEFKRQIGRATHKAIELFETNELDPNSVDEAVLPYLQSWIAFRTTKPLRVLAAEKIVYSTRYKVAGRLDLNVEFDDQPGVFWQIDAKCVDKMNPATALQTAGYLELWNERETPKLKKRAGLQLKPDGGMAEMFPYSERTDINVFLQALNVYRWRVNHGC